VNLLGTTFTERFKDGKHAIGYSEDGFDALSSLRDGTLIIQKMDDGSIHPLNILPLRGGRPRSRQSEFRWQFQSGSNLLVIGDVARPEKPPARSQFMMWKEKPSSAKVLESKSSKIGSR